MKYLFSSEGQALAKSLKRFKVLYAFDYDGTLAPLVSDLRLAVVPPEVQEGIETLERSSKVAIISGRSRRDLKKMIKFKPDFIVGNHGAEGIRINGFDLKSGTALSKKWLNELKPKIKLLKGVHIEDKKYSLSVHYREATNRSIAKRKLLKGIENLSPAPRVVLGKCVLNLVPRFAPDKGDAVRALARLTKSQKVFFVGDDQTDEDVFKLGTSRVMSVRVGQKKSSRAQFYIKNREEIGRLLNLIIT